MVRSSPGLSWGFLSCSRELVCQGSSVGHAGTKGLILEYAMSLNLLPDQDPDGEVPV